MVNRIFKAIDRNGIDQDFELLAPNLAAENEGERQYRIGYSKALVEGVFPREKLREIMKEHGMWTDEDDGQLKKVVGKIAVLQVELRNNQADGDKKECVKIARDIVETRKRMWELFLIQQSVYMNSAEGVAEMIKTESIMAACTVYKSTKQRYWKDYTEYVRERDFNEISTVYAHAVNIQAQILDDVRIGLMDDYPEREYLKSVEERIIDREVEEEVVKELRSRADVAIAKDKKKTTKKKVTKKKTNGKRVANKTKKA